jgi:hypothetical protein
MEVSGAGWTDANLTAPTPSAGQPLAPLNKPGTDGTYPVFFE